MKRPRYQRQMYENRVNQYVIQRMLTTGEIKYKHKLVKQLKDVQVRLEDVRSQLAAAEQLGDASAITQFLRHKQLQRECKQLEQEEKRWIRSVHDHKGLFQHRTTKLYHDTRESLSKLVVVERLLQGSDAKGCELFHIDPSICTICKVPYVFDSVTTTYTCVQCARTQTVLFVHADRSQDMLVEKTPVPETSRSSSNIHLQTETTVCCSAQSPTGLSGSRVSTYTRVPLYRRYLAQFADGGLVIPTEVMKCLYQYLSTIHLQTSVRCRPTPVATLLRSNGFSRWASHAVVICKRFNGESVPVLEPALIERLVKRFEFIFTVCTHPKVKQKIPSFEIITHILLCTENKPELADSFFVHKSRPVLRRTLKQFLDVLPLIHAESGPDWVWDNVPSF